MNRRQRRIISQYTSYFIFLFIVGFAWYQGSTVLEARKVNKQSAQIAAIQEEKKVLEEVKEEKVVEAAAYSVGEVLQASTGSDCGDVDENAWPNWTCDSTHYDPLVGFTYKGADPPRPKDPSTIYLRKFQYEKNTKGLFVDGGAETKKSLCSLLADLLGYDEGLCKDGSLGVDNARPGFCMASGERMLAFGEVEFSQPVMPGILAGSDVSIRHFTEDELVKFDPQIYKDIGVEQLDKLCLAAASKADNPITQEIKSRDIFGGSEVSEDLGNGFTQFLLTYCNSRAPNPSAEDISKITKGWTEEKDKDITVMMVGYINNQDLTRAGNTASMSLSDDEVEIFRKKMVKDGDLGGIMKNPDNADIQGAYTFQPKNGTLMSDSKLKGSAPGVQYTSSTLSAPNKTVAYLLEHPENIVLDQDDASSTVISAEDKYKLLETETDSLLDAIFGGLYYIPERLVDITDGKEKPISEVTTKTSLSFNKDTFNAGEYSCSRGDNSCTLVKASAKCSGFGYLSTILQLKSLIISSVNDTSSLSGVRPDGMAATYTRAGDIVGGTSRTPSIGALRNKNINDLIANSGMVTERCVSELQDLGYIDYDPDTEDIETLPFTERQLFLLKNSRYNYGYSGQAVVVTPVNVRYSIAAPYQVDLSRIEEALGPFGSWATNYLGRLIFGDSDWKYQVKKVKGEALRPALISFRIDDLIAGAVGLSPAENKKKEDNDISPSKELEEYLKYTNVRKMEDGKISCGYIFEDPEDPENKHFSFWFCSPSKAGGLPDVGCN